MSAPKSIPAGAYAAVVGAVNIDIGGRSRFPIIPRDSNPGTVHTALGGVGRNIAHNMRLLGLEVKLITLLGDDDGARMIAKSCRELGIDISGSATESDSATSTYLFITGPDGDMELALSDMEIYKKLTPEFLETRRELFDKAALVAVDANIPCESVGWLAENCRAPIFADPVSVSKSGALAPYIGKLHTLKPNRIEAEFLTGYKIDNESSLKKAARSLLSTGLQRIFISLGAEGVFAAENESFIHIPAYPSQIVNATGAGDALIAALAWAHMSGLGLEEAGRACQAAASVALRSPGTINPALSAREVARLAGLAF